MFIKITLKKPSIKVEISNIQASLSVDVLLNLKLVIFLCIYISLVFFCFFIYLMLDTFAQLQWLVETFILKTFL